MRNKKVFFFLILLSFLMTFPLLAYMEDGKSLVIYFSATGNTKRISERIASLTASDIYEIIPAVSYSSSDLNYNDSKSRSSVEMKDKKTRPAIKSTDLSLDGIGTIFIGYPIWWGDAPRIMSTFVEKYDFKDITIIPFCTSGGSGIGKSDDNLKVLSKGGLWKRGTRLSTTITDNALKSWLDEVL